MKKTKQTEKKSIFANITHVECTDDGTKFSTAALQEQDLTARILKHDAFDLCTRDGIAFNCERSKAEGEGNVFTILDGARKYKCQFMFDAQNGMLLTSKDIHCKTLYEVFEALA